MKKHFFFVFCAINKVGEKTHPFSLVNKKQPPVRSSLDELSLTFTSVLSTAAVPQLLEFVFHLY